MRKIRALVVEDSVTVRARIVETLGRDPDIAVVGEAKDGAEAVEMCRALRPDVVTLDLVLPVVSGIEATEEIMAYCPTPIVIVSSADNRKDRFRTFDALAAGALEVVEKPRGDEPEGKWERELTATVKMAARIKVITHPRARIARERRERSHGDSGPIVPPLGSLQRKARSAGDLTREVEPPPPARGPSRPLVAIGASTGGPAAVRAVLRALPGDFPLPVLVVIHVATSFGDALARWIAAESPISAWIAEDGAPLPSSGGAVIVAPPDRHLCVRDGIVRLTSEAERHSCRPSVDVLFESVAREAGARSLGCLLTGMGRDGAQGLLEIRRAGGVTIAQDEATSVVFGMPGEAARIGAAARILPVGEVARALVEFASSREPSWRRA